MEDDGNFEWEHNLKHIFILSAAGKPIFSRHGDEQELVTIFGLIQAVVSIVEDSSDEIQCIKAGNRRIVYLLKGSLYFVIVSSTGEPEVVLRQQLNFIHNQILFILTSQVQDILLTNPSRDIRELMGSDTNRLIQATCENDITQPPIVFESIRGFAMDITLRHQVLSHLKDALHGSNAAFGCIIYEDSLICFTTNDTMEVSVDVADILLLTQFVCHSSSLRSHDENCVPICLPSLNDRGFVQAYISAVGSQYQERMSSSHLSLVLISAGAADAADFKRMHESRLTLQQAISDELFWGLLQNAVYLQSSICHSYLSSVLCTHFFYKFSPRPDIPAQCIWSGELSKAPSEKEKLSRLWSHCYRLAVCLRDGSSTPECTLLTPKESSTASHSELSKDFSSAFSKPKIPANSLTRSPAADHALAYSITEEGAVIVGLATSDSELYVTFPPTVSALDGCGLANYLTRLLRKDSEALFQIA